MLVVPCVGVWLTLDLSAGRKGVGGEGFCDFLVVFGGWLRRTEADFEVVMGRGAKETREDFRERIGDGKGG